LKEPLLESQSQGLYPQGKGKTTIAPEVLLTIAKLAALSVTGISRMSELPGGVNRLFRRDYSRGVQLDIRGDVVYVHLHLVMKSGFNIREVSRQVQRSVARAIAEMVGMQVGRVNIHIEDMDYGTATELNLKEEV
jgi:uncharacterized alkaline shock family protein YloU